MSYIRVTGSIINKTTKFAIAVIGILSILAFTSLIGTDLSRARNKLSLIFSSDLEQQFEQEKRDIDSFSKILNSTHLWSLRFADENYNRLARLLPCRIVEYSGPKNGRIDSCDHSSTNEYSRESIVETQKWIYEHQHPADCRNKRFAVIRRFAWSGFGSTIHQIIPPFGLALADNRIAVYQTPGDWIYADCKRGTPDCFFLPITNCSVPSVIDNDQTILINANGGFGPIPDLPRIFQNRTFNWYRSQLLFYLMRYRPTTLSHVQHIIGQYLKPSSIELHHPYIAVYVRRSDKVQSKEMSQSFALKQYFDLFDTDARRANITTVYINSEDAHVFDEFVKLNNEKQGYYRLITINTTRNVVFSTIRRMWRPQRAEIVFQFLSDLYIEFNADLHAGTLTSNWCRLVDEMRLALGKIIPYYTPENRFFQDA